MSTVSPRLVYDRLRKSWSHAQACGILGNIEQESNFKTDVLGFDGTGSVGLCQWLGVRKAALGRFAEARGGQMTNWAVQTDFITHELNTTERRAGAKLRACSSPSDAALVFSKWYERPAAKYAHNDKRVRYANDFAREFAPGA